MMQKLFDIDHRFDEEDWPVGLRLERPELRFESISLFVGVSKPCSPATEIFI